MERVYTFDSTLRDGAQAEGISFSVDDKLKILMLLDELKVDYVEAGNPGSNSKDLEFFRLAQSKTLKHTKLAAFGSTRRKNIKVEEDTNVQALLLANTDVIVIFGKSIEYHVKKVLNTTLEENLEMIYSTLNFFTKKGKEVIFDAEHFFDGYKANKDYAIKTILTAEKAGATTIVLCDTNGGTFPEEMGEIVKEVSSKVKVKIGVHCHNDCAMAVANSIFAVKYGARHIQGTLVGFGERCGNANLSSIIANLQLKQGYDLIGNSIKDLKSIAIKISEISNINLNDQMPFIGNSAFSHKGGMHVDAVLKSPDTFEHMDPTLVGNERRVLTSEVAGRTTILSKIQSIDSSVDRDSKETTEIINKLKELEFMGYQFEGAESSFELLIRKLLGKYKPLFELIDLKIIHQQPYKENMSTTAVVKILVGEQVEISVGEGNGPVNALDMALRKVLENFYPNVKDIHLKDYKVRVLNGQRATASKVRVLIESTDNNSTWNTVGVSTDIIEASWIALVDSIEYKIIKDFEENYKAFL
ncbi:MAG: citramalate synthase [Lachnospirales bacterium]